MSRRAHPGRSSTSRLLIVVLAVLAAVVVGATASVSVAEARQCNDFIDNDRDGFTDYPFDPGCQSLNDNNEADPVVTPPPPAQQCADGVDNDRDTKVDFSEDPGCASALDNDETDPPRPQCGDGLDNDADGSVDAVDRGCASPLDNDETDPVVVVLGLTAEAPPLLRPFPLVRLRGLIFRRGARVTRLTVKGPAGAQVTITCRGRSRSCPRNTTTRTMTGATARFRTFERRMRTNTILRIYVTKPGYVGKYTRFKIRRNRTPLRTDACALPATKSVACG
jgi:hypothetical protein